MTIFVCSLVLDTFERDMLTVDIAANHYSCHRIE